MVFYEQPVPDLRLAASISPMATGAILATAIGRTAQCQGLATSLLLHVSLDQC